MGFRLILVFGQDHRHPKNLRLTVNESFPYLPGLSPLAGKDICTRLYAVNNLPRGDEQDKTSTITVFEISSENAE